MSQIKESDPEAPDKMALAAIMNESHGMGIHYGYDNANGIAGSMYGDSPLKDVVRKLKKTNEAAVKYRQRNELASDIAITGHATPEQIQRLQQITASMPDPKETYDGLPRQALDFLYSMGYGGRVGLAAGGAAALTTEISRSGG